MSEDLRHVRSGQRRAGLVILWLTAAGVLGACGELGPTLQLDALVSNTEDAYGEDIEAPDGVSLAQDASEPERSDVASTDGGGTICSQAHDLMEDCAPEALDPIPPEACFGQVAKISQCLVTHFTEACALAQSGAAPDAGTPLHACLDGGPADDAGASDAARLDTSTPLDLGT